MDQCRLCLNQIDLIDVYDKRLKEASNLRKFVFVTLGIEIKEDDVSRYICRSCSMVAIKLFNYRISAQATDKHLTEVFAREDAATALLDREIASVSDKLNKCTSAAQETDSKQLTDSENGKKTQHCAKVYDAETLQISKHASTCRKLNKCKSAVQETDSAQLNDSKHEKSDSGKKTRCAKSYDSDTPLESKRRRIPKPASKRFRSARRISSTSTNSNISNLVETLQPNSDTETIAQSSSNEVLQRCTNDKLPRENIVKPKETDCNALKDSFINKNLKEKVLHAHIKEHSSVLDILRDYPNIKIPTNILYKNVSPTLTLNKRFVKQYLKYQKIRIKRNLHKQKDALVSVSAVEVPPSAETLHETNPILNNFEDISSNTQIETTRIGNIIIKKIVPTVSTKDAVESKTCLDPEDILNISTKNLKIGNTLIGKVGITSPSETIDFRLDGGKLHKIRHPIVEIPKRNANPTLDTSGILNALLHKCDTCKRAFGDVPQLNKHITEHHKCHLCHAKNFSNKQNLKEHINSCEKSRKLTGNRSASNRQNSDDSVKSTKKITINNGNVKIGSIFIVKAKESQKSSVSCLNTQQQYVVSAKKVFAAKNKLTTSNIVLETANNTEENTPKIRIKEKLEDQTNQGVAQRTEITNHLSSDAEKNHSAHLESNKITTNNQVPCLSQQDCITTLNSFYKEAKQKSRKEENINCPPKINISEEKHSNHSLSSRKKIILHDNTAKTENGINETATNFKNYETNNNLRRDTAEHDIKHQITLKNGTVLPKHIKIIKSNSSTEEDGIDITQYRSKEETKQKNHNVVPPNAEVGRIIACTLTNEKESTNKVECKYCHLKLLNENAKREHLISCFSYIKQNLPVIRLQKMETDPNIVNKYFESIHKAPAKQANNKRKRSLKVQASDDAVDNLLSELFSSDSETSNNDSDSDFIVETSETDSEDSLKDYTDMSSSAKFRKTCFRKSRRNNDSSLALNNKSITVEPNLANNSAQLMKDGFQTYLAQNRIVPRQLLEHSNDFVQTSSTLNKTSKNKPTSKTKDTLTYKSMQQYPTIINNVSNSTATHYALVKYQTILPKPTLMKDSHKLTKITADGLPPKSNGNSSSSANVLHSNSLIQQNSTNSSFVLLSKQQCSNVPSSNILQTYLLQQSSTYQPIQNLLEKGKSAKVQNLLKETNEPHSVVTAFSSSKDFTLKSPAVQEQTNQMHTLLSNSVASNLIFLQKSTEGTFTVPSSASTSTQPNIYNSSTSFLCINNSFLETPNVYHTQSMQPLVMPFQLIQNNINTSQANPSVCIATPPCINYNIVPTPNIIQVQNIFNNSNQERSPIIQTNNFTNICATQLLQSTQNILQAGSYSGYNLNNLFSTPNNIIQLQQPNTTADTVKIVDITSD